MDSFFYEITHLLKSHITTANFRLAKCEKPQFTWRK